jgi:1-deoxy-D-xylulose-5-phosphate reductoisomerase
MRAVSLVGSTGSIGTQALEVIGLAPEEFRVAALGANSSVTALAEQANRFRPEVVGIVDESLAKTLASLVPKGTEVISGPGVLATLAGIGDVVLNAVVGFAGLSVTVEALRSGRRLALANKESLIAGAPVVQRGSRDRRCRDRAGGLRALCHPPVPRPASPRACRITD